MQQAKGLLAAIGIVRREDDEAALREPRRWVLLSVFPLCYFALLAGVRVGEVLTLLASNLVLGRALL